MPDWNDYYARGETPWDRGTHAPVLDVLGEKTPALFRGRVLVPGCGLGHDARWLAARGCQVVALDIAPLAIERARILDKEGLVEFRLENLFDLPPDLRGGFDLVWEHTCLCALDPAARGQYVRGVRSALKEGGSVAGIFYLNPDLDPGETGPPFGVSTDELAVLWEAGGFRIEERWVPEVAYEGRVGRELFLRLRLEGASAA